jgi:hypothetical protein
MAVTKLLHPLQRKECEVDTYKAAEDTVGSSKRQSVVNDKLVEEFLKADTTLCSIDEKIDTSFNFALQNVVDEISHGEISNNSWILQLVDNTISKAVKWIRTIEHNT